MVPIFPVPRVAETGGILEVLQFAPRVGQPFPFPSIGSPPNPWPTPGMPATGNLLAPWSTPSFPDRFNPTLAAVLGMRTGTPINPGNKRVIDVRDYGAIADCTVDPSTGAITGTDNYAMILAAYNALLTSSFVGGSSGGILLFYGLFRMRSPLTVILPYITFQGVGEYTHVTAYIPPSGIVFDPVSATGDAITLDTDTVTTSQGAQFLNFAVLTKTDGAAIKNVTGTYVIRGCKLHSILGSLDGAIPSSSEGSGLYNTRGGFRVEDSYISGFYRGLNIPSGHGFLISGTQVIGNDINCVFGGGTDGIDGTLVGNVIQDAITGDIDLIDCARLTVHGNYFEYGNAGVSGHPYCVRMGHGGGNMTRQVSWINNYHLGNSDASASWMIIERTVGLRCTDNIVLSGYGPLVNNVHTDTTKMWFQNLLLLDPGANTLATAIDDYTGVIFDDFSGYPNFRTGFDALNTQSLAVTGYLTKAQGAFQVSHGFNTYFGDASPGKWGTLPYPGSGMLAINPFAGGYDVGIGFVQGDSASSILNGSGELYVSGVIFMKGEANWSASVTANRISTMIFATYNASGVLIDRMEIASSGDILMNKKLHVVDDVQFDKNLTVTTDTALVGKLGVNGATPVATQTVTGSRTDGTALLSLLSKFVNYGFIIDSTSA